jgi:branched-chain amino acid transport system substrate-binding protein
MLKRIIYFIISAMTVAGAYGETASRLTPPTNVWEATQLYEIIKDTKSVFIEANEPYIASIQGSFPEIQTSEDLVGKNDYDFYPPELALAFQTDDRRVMDSGEPLTQFEINRLQNGETRIIQAHKTPLLDSKGNVVGLRVAFAEIPELKNRWLLRTPKRGCPRSARPPARIKIGALLSLTGTWSSLGNDCEAALQLGIAQLNKTAMEQEKPGRYVLLVRNTKLNPDRAVKQLKDLHRKGVRVVIGPQSSAEARALLPVANRLGMLLVSPSSTASSLSIARDNLLRFCPDDRLEASASAAVAFSEGTRTLVTVARNDVGNMGLYQSIQKSFTGFGGTVVGGFAYGTDTIDFAPVVQQIADLVAQGAAMNKGPVGVYLAGFDEVADLFRAAANNPALTNVAWYGGDGTVLSTALQEPNAAGFATSVGYPCPTLGIPEGQVKNSLPISSLIRMRTGNQPEAFALAAYDSLMVIARAVHRTNILPPPSALRPLVMKSAKTYVGLTGPTILNTAGDRKKGAYEFFKLGPAEGGFSWFSYGTWTTSGFEPTPQIQEN